MSIDFTVAICTHNGSTRVPAVLEQLQNQVGVDGICWEVLVVDNNSTDRTASVIRNYQANWSSSRPLRYVFEPELGLAIARQRAIDEARGSLIGFLDDDNVPSAGWVASAYQFGQEHPQVGAYGSRIYGNFEVPPPENFERIAPLLALTDRGDKPRLYLPQQKILPPGAGLVVRKQAWLDTVPERCFLQGRASGLKLPGEDLEALLYIQQSHWEIWYNPEMVVHHQIPRQRLEQAYLVNLCRGIGLSRYHTRMLSTNRWKWFLIFPLYVINDLRKVIVHRSRYGRFVKTDLVAACEMELHLSSLMSPFYLLPVYIRNRYFELLDSQSRKKRQGIPNASKVPSSSRS